MQSLDTRLSQYPNSPALISSTPDFFKKPGTPPRHLKSQQDSKVIDNMRQLSLTQPPQSPLSLEAERPRSYSCGPQFNFIHVLNFNSSSTTGGTGDDISASQLPDISSYESQFSPEDTFSDLEFSTFCSGHLKNWKNTAREGFGLSEARVSQLESDNMRLGSKECAHQAYLEWRQTSGFTSPTTVQQMVQILHKVGEGDAISNLIGNHN
jgi:hypothetical protein